MINDDFVTPNSIQLFNLISQSYHHRQINPFFLFLVKINYPAVAFKPTPGNASLA